MINYKDKKVAVLGTGVEGLSSARFLKNQGARVTLLDQKSQEELPHAIVVAAQELKVDVYWGPNYLALVKDFDVVVRTPVIRPDLPELEDIKKLGKEVTSNTKIFFDVVPCKIIGVTGTKGKGTTSTLIYEMLKRAGKKVYLGGNIGTPPLDFLPDLTPDSWVVLELSSFQLFDLEKSPNVGVVLMVTSEHLDWHKDVNEYKQAKFQILAHQVPEDFGIVNVDYPVTREFLEIGQGKKVKVSTLVEDVQVYKKDNALWRRFETEEKIVDIADIGLVGAHNHENILAAVGAVSCLNIPIDPITAVVKEFKGLENRLEFVREVEGVRFYNDTFSTTPETAMAAIKSFENPEIVILGGSDKGSDYTQLGQIIVHSPNVKALILIGLMGPKIGEAVEKAGKFSGQILTGAKNMEEIISQARSVASNADVVLLSPACASFDMFASYKDRGKQFKETVNKL